MEPVAPVTGGMVRWQPGALDRLQAAALERFAGQGYDATTVAEIAATAGLTERTFFRFADKREVLFGRQDEFVRPVVTVQPGRCRGRCRTGSVGERVPRG